MTTSKDANPLEAVQMGEVLERARDKGLAVRVTLEPYRGQRDLITYEAGEKLDPLEFKSILADARQSAVDIVRILGVTVE